MNETTVFELQFKTEDNKNKTISLRHAKPDIDATTAQKALENIIATQAFKQDNIQLFAKPVGARYVTRQVDTVYAVSNPED